jgi:hypothetical protein
MSEKLKISVELEIEDESNLKKQQVELADQLMVDLNKTKEYKAQTERGPILDLIVSMGTNAQEYSEVLKVLFTAAGGALTLLNKRHADKQVEVEVEIGGIKHTIRGKDSKTVARMVEEFKAAHPTLPEAVSPADKPKIKGKVKKK